MRTNRAHFGPAVMCRVRRPNARLVAVHGVYYLDLLYGQRGLGEVPKEAKSKDIENHR